MFTPTIYPKEKGEPTRFIIGLCVPFAISFLYWPIILLQAPSYSEGMVWLQNNPSLSVFQLVFLPIISGILMAGIDPKHLRGLFRANKVLMGALIVILLAMGTLRVIQDSEEALTNRVIEPLEFRSKSDRALFAAKHAELRKRVPDTVEGICPELATQEKPPSTASACYKEFTLRHFGGEPVTLVSHGGIVSWWQRLLSLQAAVLVMFLVWYLLGSAFARSRPPKHTFEAIILCLAIAVSWFPLRLYSEWFVNFRSLGTLSSYGSMFLVGLVLLIAVGAAFYLRSEKPAVSIVAGIIAGLSGISGIIAKISPETFGIGANVFEGISPAAFLSVELLLFLFLISLLRFRTNDNRVPFRSD
jgi:hypothetical protein